jgi:hypothetical protein
VTIDWVAVYSPDTYCCYYVSAVELGSGRRKGIRYAADYLDPEPPIQAELEVEPAGLEPAPSSVQGKRSPN